MADDDGQQINLKVYIRLRPAIKESEAGLVNHVVDEGDNEHLTIAPIEVV